MIKKVIKKGGKKEPFQKEKIETSLKKAIESTKIEKKESKEIFEKTMKELEGFLVKKREITTAEIEAKILLILENIAPEIAQSWRDYRRKKVK